MNLWSNNTCFNCFVNGNTMLRNVCISVFTSSVNVRFNKTPIENGTEEDEEESDIREFIDHYSRTKYEAERIVLNAQNDTLKTCCLR